MKKFTVITICLNSERDIEKTILSVLHQSSTNFEYIIKDGQSTDQTVAIAESFAPAFAKRGISYSVLSQKDTGIYDAMNQAIQQSQGEWLLFMNAGDRFAMNDVLSLVKMSGYLETAEIVYGDVILEKEDEFQYRKPMPLEKFYDDMPFCHQSVFTKRCLFEKNLYSTCYRISSDYEFYLKMYVQKRVFEYIPVAFAIFNLDGFSVNNWELCMRERISIYQSMPVCNDDAIQAVQRRINEAGKTSLIRRVALEILPAGITQMIKARNKRKAGWVTEERIERLNAGYMKEAMQSFQDGQKKI